jgi:uncharacterized protein involved in tolerance to divalent cations
MEYKQPLRRSMFKNQNQEEDLHKVVMVTSDDRVAQLIEEIAAGLKNSFFDVLVTTLASSSKEYSDWVKL